MTEDRANKTTDENNPCNHTVKHAAFPPWVDTTFEVVLAFILFAELVVMFGNVVLRAVFTKSFDGAGEVASLALMAMAFIGGAIAYYKDAHIAVRVFVDKLPVKWQSFVDAFGVFIVLVLASAGLVLDWPIIVDHWGDETPILGVSRGLTYIPFAIGMALLIIFAIKRLTEYPLRTIATALAATVGLLALWYFVPDFTGPWNGPGGLAIAGILLFLAIGIGVPIGFVMPAVAYLYLISSRGAQIDAIPLAMTNGISGFIMLAIPFFILAGHIMTEGGLTKPLANWVNAIVGRVQGGLLHAVVVSVFIFSGISGSKIADIAAVGTTMREMLKEKGYKPAEYSAVLGASGIMGETIPPSLPLLVLPAITTLSVGAFFVAGIVPAILMAICLAIYIAYRAKAQQWPKGEKVPLSEIARLTFRAIPVLFVPVMLVVGIAGGVATPTEVSSFAVIYGMFASLIIYRKIGIRDTVKIFAHSGVVAGMILFIISAGSCFSWTMTVANLPVMITDFVHTLGGSHAVFMMITLVVLIIMGGVLEGLPAILIFAPLLLPIAVQYGIDGIHYGIVLIFAMGLGSFIPPFGLSYYVTCSVGQTTPEALLPRYIPYILVLFVGLLLVTFVPWFSLALPKALHLIK